MPVHLIASRPLEQYKSFLPWRPLSQLYLKLRVRFGRPPLGHLTSTVLTLRLALQQVLLGTTSMAMVRGSDRINHEEGGLKGIPGGMLNNVPSLATTFVLIISSITLVVHEIYVLSPVVLLYLQAAILALTTVSATTMWMNCVGEDDAMLKCVLISCSVFFLGTSGLAFLRAVVIWKVTGSDESEGLGQIRADGEVQEENYATF
ncbi:hypothetical protein T069G_03078 [Trichoderma breve]|uniref:Uncharacterized protein n=1 Tax=Trichoderma breve TaxID=2034170 RepID=A0A9W9BH03_9HYPO|nr:hypothetical protein T069G_03078 [Trichoderma breve]KAJ4862124.1 hypothetical protein T069G_03078 [Trichoderma breve]